MSLIAIALAIRDHLFDGGIETVWEPDKASIPAVQEYAALLLNQRHEQFYMKFSEPLKKALPLSQFTQYIQRIIRDIGPITAITDIKEIEIHKPLYISTDFEQDFDTIVQITFFHDGCNKSQMELYLKKSSQFQIITIHHTGAPDGLLGCGAVRTCCFNG